MNYAYYVVRKDGQQILDGAENMVDAIKLANEYGFACYIMQGCVISEVGEDASIEEVEQSVEEDETE